MLHVLPKAPLGRRLRPDAIRPVLRATINCNRHLGEVIEFQRLGYNALLRVWWNLSACLEAGVLDDRQIELLKWTERLNETG